jgi:hypothetical protein
VPPSHTKRPFTKYIRKSIFDEEEFQDKVVRRGRATCGFATFSFDRNIACASESPRRKSEMTNNSERSFAIIRFNEKTYVSGGVMAVIKGTESAQRALNDFEWCQDQEDRSSGWRYFLEETDLQPGTDPAKATRLRQLQLDLHESQAKSY